MLPQVFNLAFLNAYILVYEESKADLVIMDRLNQFQYLTGPKDLQEGTYL